MLIFNKKEMMKKAISMSNDYNCAFICANNDLTWSVYLSMGPEMSEQADQDGEVENSMFLGKFFKKDAAIDFAQTLESRLKNFEIGGEEFLKGPDIYPNGLS